MKKSLIIFMVLMAINAPVFIVYLLFKGITYEEMKKSFSQMAEEDEEGMKNILYLINLQLWVIATMLMLVYLLVWWLV